MWTSNRTAFIVRSEKPLALIRHERSPSFGQGRSCPVCLPAFSIHQCHLTGFQANLFCFAFAQSPTILNSKVLRFRFSLFRNLLCTAKHVLFCGCPKRRNETEIFSFEGKLSCCFPQRRGTFSQNQIQNSSVYKRRLIEQSFFLHQHPVSFFFYFNYFNLTVFSVFVFNEQ